MSLFTARSDIIQPNSQPSGTAAQTIRFRVPQEVRRLEGFTLLLALTTAGTAITGAAWGGLAAVVKEIRVMINDQPAGGGQRNVVQVSGVGLLSYLRQVGDPLDRQTQVGYTSDPAGIPTSTTVQLAYYIPLRHPQLSEPFGAVTALPLSSKFLATDVWVEVDLWDIAASGTVFTTNPPSYAASNAALLQPHLLEMDENFPYLRTELRTDTGFSTSATANVPYEFVSGGIITGFLVQGFSAALGSATTRSTLLSTGGQMRLEYGRTVVGRTNEAFAQALNDRSSGYLYPNNAPAIGTGGQLSARMFAGESYFDFLTQGRGQDAFSLASTFDLNTDALGGDKFRLYFNDLASASRPIHVTYHKLLSAREQIISVSSALAKQGANA